jgi:hypothetical protein
MEAGKAANRDACVWVKWESQPVHDTVCQI